MMKTRTVTSPTTFVGATSTFCSVMKGNECEGEDNISQHGATLGYFFPKNVIKEECPALMMMIMMHSHSQTFQRFLSLR